MLGPLRNRTNNSQLIMTFAVNRENKVKDVNNDNVLTYLELPPSTQPRPLFGSIHLSDREHLTKVAKILSDKWIDNGVEVKTDESLVGKIEFLVGSQF